MCEPLFAISQKSLQFSLISGILRNKRGGGGGGGGRYFFDGTQTYNGTFLVIIMLKFVSNIRYTVKKSTKQNK